MAFCANCGTEVVGKFCAKCGTAVAAGGPAAPGGYAPPQGGGFAPQPQRPQGGYPPPPQGGYAPQGAPPQQGYAPPQGGYAPPQGSYAPPPQGGYPPPPQGGYPAPGTQASGLTDNVAAALSYITIVGIVFLFIEPYNRNRVVRFHAFQSIFFAVATVVIWIAATILSVVLSPIPVVGVIFGVILHLVLWLGILIVWLMLVYKAYNNEQFMLPVIGPMAQKQV